MNFPDLVRNRFREKTIVVVGDLVADQFLRGTISRVSREAPVFILRHDETETLPGGAANTAANIASLGAKAVLIGVVGDDRSGEQLLARLDAVGVDRNRVVADPNFSTTTKVRVLAGQHYAARQQVIRIDYENGKPIAAETLDAIRSRILEAVSNADAVVVSDYSYGAADPEIGRICIDAAKERGIPVIADSRFRLGEFRHATSATPNQEEVEQILGADFTETDCVSLCSSLGFDSLLVTRGNQGMLLAEPNKQPFTFPAIGSKEPVDVTGAGDTVIAVYALGLASGLSFSESARLANHAGGIVVMKKGTATVTPEELVHSLEDARPEDTASK